MNNESQSSETTTLNESLTSDQLIDALFDLLEQVKEESMSKSK